MVESAKIQHDCQYIFRWFRWYYFVTVQQQKQISIGGSPSLLSYFTTTVKDKERQM